MTRKQKGGYFKVYENAPQPLTLRISKIVEFNETDAMGIVWHGNYVRYFEEASSAIGRKAGLPYELFIKEGIYVPYVQIHADYHKPLKLEEKFDIFVSLVWYEGARLNKEYLIYGEDGEVSVSGYSVQMFVDGTSGAPFFDSPPFLRDFQNRWLNGKISVNQLQ